MITEQARVVAVDADGLWLETLKQSACASCAAKSGCGQRLFHEFRASTASMTLIKVAFSPDQHAQQWQVGDQAQIGIEEQALVKAALLLYGMPLLGLVFGAWLGNLIVPASEALALFGALFGLFTSAAAMRLYMRRSASIDAYQANIVGKMLPTRPSPMIVTEKMCK